MYPSPVSLPCNLIALRSLFKITLPELQSGSVSHSVSIAGITNPAKGGTGNFRLETRRGDLNLLDYNHFFESVGIDESPLGINSFTVSRSENEVNKIASYVFGFQLAVKVPKDGAISVDIEGKGIIFGGIGSSNAASKMSIDLTEKRILIYVSIFDKM